MDEQEPTGGDVPNEQWPASGAIKFTDISVRYAPDLPEVLHKVSFDIEVSNIVIFRDFEALNS